MVQGALYLTTPLGAIMDAISVRTLCYIFKLVSVPGTFMLHSLLDLKMIYIYNFTKDGRFLNL